MRVICEKISTRDPRSLSRGSSLSSSTILPLFSTRWSPARNGGPGSAPWNRYGWLQHLRSCMTTLSRRERSALPSMAATSFCRSALYHLRCISDMPIFKMVSFLGGRLRSTSALRRRSRKGRRTLCSWPTTSASRALLASASSAVVVAAAAPPPPAAAPPPPEPPAAPPPPAAAPATAAGSSAPVAPNHSSNFSDDENTSGSRKLSSAHSSCRLF